MPTMPQPRRIAINGRFLSQTMVGVQRVAIEVTKAFDRLLMAAPYSSLAGRIEILAPRNAREHALANIPVRKVGLLTGYAWEQIELPLHAGRDLLVNLCLLGPVIKRHQMILAHDATVRAMPTNFSLSFRAAYSILVPLLLRHSDRVVTISDFSRREIAKYYGIDAGSIPVCHEGADHITAVAADNTILDRLQLKGRLFLLGVGINSRNKNIENAIAAFLKSGLDDTLFVLTGHKDLRVFDYAPNTTHANVRMAGYVSDAELRALYENALALVFPSRYEGFGLPPVEAMQCGCPVIVSDQGALVEIGGDAVRVCGMDDIDALAQAMRAIHDDAALRKRMKAASLARVRSLTWERMARCLLDLCLDTAARRAAAA
jgi:glycosyltransferase involved in cell wall biosynthesis